MNYLELSKENLGKESLRLAKQIETSFRPEVVVFISKGSYSIGMCLSDYFQVPLVEIFATRKGNVLKDKLSVILKLIPQKVKIFLRKREINSGIHDKNSKREIYIKKGHDNLKKAKNILVIDDSVDTGNTAKQVVEYISDNFKNKDIRFASINYFDMSKKIYKVDYSLYKNHIIIGPWSKDSKYYSGFIKSYNLAKQKEVF